MSTAEFEFEEQDSTLGTLLQYSLLKDKDVKYAAYIQKHPGERIIKVKITSKSVDPEECLIKSIKELIKELDFIENEFKK